MRAQGGQWIREKREGRSDGRKTLMLSQNGARGLREYFLMPRESFDSKEVKFSVSECIKIYMHFNQNFARSKMVCPDFPFE